MVRTEVVVNTITGVGYSLEDNSFHAGVEIANNSLAGNELLDHTLFFLFASYEHDIEELMKGIRSIAGDKPAFLGCSSKGVVTKDQVSYLAKVAGGGFISSAQSFFKSFFETDIKDREFEAGRKLADQIKLQQTPESASFILFYDSMKQTVNEGAPMLNLCTPILEGFRQEYGFWPLIAGIGSFSDLNFSFPCAVWADGKIQRQGMGAVALTGAIQMNQIILRGTRPIGGYHTVTKAAGNIIYELDNQPALELISEIMGSTLSWEEFPFFITLGVNNGDKYGPYNEDEYFSRLCFSVDKENKSLVMFETDLVDGMEVQLMRRDIDLSYIRPRVNRLLTELGDRKPLFAFYIDCVGRVSAFSGMLEEESEEVARAIGDIPFFGIFSGVEIGKVGKDIKALDWTGVLCVFSET